MKTVLLLAGLIASVGAVLPFPTPPVSRSVSSITPPIRLLGADEQSKIPGDTTSLPSYEVKDHSCNHLKGSGKLVPNDTRVQYASAEIRGKTYHYMMGVPESVPPVGTIFLIHGFPDLGFGWRHQVPYLMCLGYRVVVPDMLGYANNSRPEDLHHWTMKSMSADVKELADKVASGEQIILGGHDWGGHLAWRVAMWHPGLIKAIFSICTPFMPPMSTYLSMETLAAGPHKHFRYILQFMGSEIETAIREQQEVRQFLNAIFDGLDPRGKTAYDAYKGVSLDMLPTLSRSVWFSEDEMSYYTDKFMLQKPPRMRGPLNWYRTRRLNWEDEWILGNRTIVLETPALFIAALRDPALPPALSADMQRYVPNLTRKEVNSSHWALWEKSEQINEMVGKWLRS